MPTLRKTPSVSLPSNNSYTCTLICSSHDNINWKILDIPNIPLYELHTIPSKEEFYSSRFKYVIDPKTSESVHKYNQYIAENLQKPLIAYNEKTEIYNTTICFTLGYPFIGSHCVQFSCNDKVDHPISIGTLLHLYSVALCSAYEYANKNIWFVMYEVHASFIPCVKQIKYVENIQNDKLHIKCEIELSNVDDVHIDEDISLIDDSPVEELPKKGTTKKRVGKDDKNIKKKDSVIEEVD